MDNALGIGVLVDFIKRIPSVQGSIGNGVLGDDGWWLKFVIDISHPLAWRTVQELGHVLNYLSMNERLPTVFMPVSPSPCMNGGPTDFLSWVIECHDSTFPPSMAAEWLEGRLPVPVNEPAAWAVPDDV